MHTSTLLQRATHYYLTHFNAAEHVEKIRQTYKARRDLMLTELKANFSSQVRWTDPTGGMFIWLTLPENYDTGKLLPHAATANVAYVPGIHFFANGGSHSSMRLNFSNPTPLQIKKGIKLLAEILAVKIK